MTHCEMCGTDTNLVNALIEEVELKVCKNCAAYGKVLRKPKKTNINSIKVSATTSRSQKEIVQIIVSNFSKIIREKREKTGTQQGAHGNRFR